MQNRRKMQYYRENSVFLAFYAVNEIASYIKEKYNYAMTMNMKVNSCFMSLEKEKGVEKDV